MSTSTDASFVDQMVANVALQFLDRVDRSPRKEAFRYPEGERLDLGHLGRGGRAGRRVSPPACSRSASSPSSGSASPPAPATSGSSPTWR